MLEGTANTQTASTTLQDDVLDIQRSIQKKIDDNLAAIEQARAALAVAQDAYDGLNNQLQALHKASQELDKVRGKDKK